MAKRLERFEAKAGIKKPRTVERKIKAPDELAYLLDWYDACRGGQSRGMEVEPLSHQEIVAFYQGHHLEWESFDTIMLRRLDGPWFDSLPKREAAPAPRPQATGHRLGPAVGPR